jgi:hypothetical protein
VRVAVEPREQLRETTKKLASGLYFGRNGSGFILFWASGDRRWVPEEEVQVAVTVIEPDIRLQETHGSPTVRIAKLSDK